MNLKKWMALALSSAALVAAAGCGGNSAPAKSGAASGSKVSGQVTVSGSSAQTGSPAQRQNRSSQGNQDLHNTGYPRESSGNGSPGCDQNSGGGYHPSYEDYMNIPEEGEEEGLPFH